MLLGLAGGGGSLAASHLVVSYFGKKNFSSIFAIAMIPGQLGSALGPVFAAWIFDLFDSYTIAWLLCGVFGAVSIVLFLLSAHFAGKLSTFD